jgi:hypothetical protein
MKFSRADKEIDQGTVANKSKLRRVIHINQFFYVSTRFTSTVKAGA